MVWTCGTYSWCRTPREFKKRVNITMIFLGIYHMNLTNGFHLGIAKLLEKNNAILHLKCFIYFTKIEIRRPLTIRFICTCYIYIKYVCQIAIYFRPSVGVHKTTHVLSSMPLFRYCTFEVIVFRHCKEDANEITASKSRIAKCFDFFLINCGIQIYHRIAKNRCVAIECKVLKPYVGKQIHTSRSMSRNKYILSAKHWTFIINFKKSTILT